MAVRRARIRCAFCDKPSQGRAQGKEEVFHFLETVLLEVLQLFPSSYIHIGGDEARRPTTIAQPCGPVACVFTVGSNA